ncbi:MAG: rRNA pseudouridine synthase [Cyanobacteria bacterium SIG28]|nr:rRNA pseudouridine synthase [Cyanobacteria bacterium SIG28]
MLWKQQWKKVKMQRLNKFIASSGICSRRKADEYIEQGKVTVNGKVVTELGFQIGPKDKVLVENKLIKPLKNEYYRFYKPAGYITTSEDEKGRKTIYDIIPPELKKLKPVGRLDKESTGLIVMTNDGELINEMTHPSIKVPKTYIVTINGKLTPEDGEKMFNGLEIETDTGEKKTAYAEVLPIELGNKSSMVQVVLYQGINRQIRKMFAVLGFEVVSLKRIQHGTITLDGLKKGQIKPMKPKHVKELKGYLAKLRKANNA